MSQQVVTLWSDSDIAKAVNDRRARLFLDLAQPQGITLHARAFALASKGPALTEMLLKAYPGIRVFWAIAGDWGSPSIPGHSDGWEEAAVAGLGCGISALQLNCEPAWKKLKKGSAKQAVLETHEAAPELPLWHTSYGAPSYHLDYPWAEFLGADSPIVATAPQIYWARKNGESEPRGYGTTWAAKYASSIRWAQRNGLISPRIEIHGYLQAYDCRTDELCACSDDYPVTHWWTVPSRLDEAGGTAIRAMCELYRRGLKIEEFQRQAGLVVDGLVGRRTLSALGIV